MPFRFDEDNVLKAMAEAHLFLMLMVCLVLKGDLEGEFLHENGAFPLPAPNLCICTHISVFFEPYSSSVPPCISVPNQRAVVRRL